MTTYRTYRFQSQALIAMCVVWRQGKLHAAEGVTQQKRGCDSPGCVISEAPPIILQLLQRGLCRAAGKHDVNAEDA